ncbi:MAG: hypothetical protein MUE82_11140, partial [Chloroflexi bacterium]|nr:hypothetical protein [Chloroflexota bacterium]
LDPLVDVTPAEVVGAFVTEAGIIRPPFGAALAGLAASVAGRRPQPGPTGRDALSGPVGLVADAPSDTDAGPGPDDGPADTEAAG